MLETMGMYSCSEGLEMIKGTKDNMIDYYNEKEMYGEYIYKRVVNDIMNMMDEGMVGVKVKREKVQKKLDVVRIGTHKCRYCEKEFDVNRGFFGVYCSKKCYYAYSRSMEFRIKSRMRYDWEKKNRWKP